MRSIRVILVIVLVLYWVTMFVLTHMPPRNLPGVGMNDKVQHFLGYGALGTLLYLTIWAFWPEFRFAWLVVIVVAMCYGAADEITQTLVGRTCDFYDWLADVGGSVLAAATLTTFRWAKWKRTIARQRDAWKAREEVRARLAGEGA